jgi:hypothetical protein
MAPMWPTTALPKRCESIDGSLRCQGDDDHRGPHWADVGRGNAVLRWGMRGYGCFDSECIRAPGHAEPHRNGLGMSWVPIDPDYMLWTPDEGRVL